ncbi:MAG: Clp protease ClpP [Lactococcus chungangensis]|uniref:Clp protease ClpP n=1 Tax=Pseudolactococcus chungangensis TaxID=451457 RepID=A0A847J663_9LACT|nr:Clp protease ClpP [Lactococcus chungangensis]
MGHYSEYLDKKFNFDQISQERKRQLEIISRIRGGRDILVYASDLSRGDPSIGIDYSDLLPFQDQLDNLKGKEIDIILETPGGIAEVVEDMVKLVRGRYEKVGIIIPGWAKSAGTIFAMAGDEILMGPMSGLGPIDAQVMMNNKRFSAEAFLKGLEKIKEEVIKTGKLNAAFIPILQNISPGEIQHCENAQDFSEKLVTDWLSEYKFKYWHKHSSTGAEVTVEDKKKRAKEIAGQLCKHSDWLTHARSIKIGDFQKMKLIIEDFSLNAELNDAIMRYYTLLRMSFETTIYKIYETTKSQIYRFSIPPGKDISRENKNEIVEIKFECPKCKNVSMIQANLEKKSPLKNTNLPYPLDNNIFKCPHCGAESDISKIKLEIEAQTGKNVV